MKKQKSLRLAIKKAKHLMICLLKLLRLSVKAPRRVLGLYPYHVQLMGGISLHEGNISEMKTGEGKTLTATMPVYLNALSGKGVHVITVNEYLASRDANEMGAVVSIFRPNSWFEFKQYG